MNPRFGKKERLLLALSLVLSLVSAEVLLRVLGFGVWTSAVNVVESTVRPDSVLGWRNIPNLSLERREGESSLRYTTWNNGSRATAPSENNARREMVILGCSFTNGTRGLSDDQTYAWKLQQQFPDVHIINFGTEAYSPYQALLLLEEKLQQGLRPTVVLFGFVTFHESRNIADPAWLKMIAAANQYPAQVPYATLDSAGELTHRSARYTEIPFQEYSVLMNALGGTIANFAARDRVDKGPAVMRAVLTRMRQRAEDAGAVFQIVFLHPYFQQKEHYNQLFSDWGLPFIDCTLPEVPNISEYALRENGHPNERANTFWAECIAKKVNELLPK